MTAVGQTPEAAAADRAVVERWWQQFAATGTALGEWQLVQGRLIRSVHRADLPSGPAFVKVMTFPRAKDRLRYAFRALPATHEAAMLAATRAAGILCPEVCAVCTRRKLLLPHRSMLVLRGLELQQPDEGSGDAQSRLHEEIDVAARLLEAGIHHRDLHQENFVRTAAGEVAVLDMQSASRSPGVRAPGSRARVQVAARLLRDRHDIDRAAALAYMHSRRLLARERDVAVVAHRAESEAERYRMSRIRRCLTTSTEFERRLRWTGIEYSQRGELGEGRWWQAGSRGRAAWLGQRERYLRDGTAPAFRAFFAKWWWLGGGGGLYVPSQWSDERIESEVAKASASARA